MPDMIVHVKSYLVWDFVSEVENRVLSHWDVTIPAVSFTEVAYMFFKSFANATSNEFNAPLKAITDEHV